MMAVTPADIQAIAKKYIKPERSDGRPIPPRPDRRQRPQGRRARRQKAEETKNAPVVASDKPIEPRVKESEFPQGYPTKPPVTDKAIKATFEKGVETTVNGVQVITMTDHRLPLANFNLILRGGGDAQPNDKVGLASIAAAMMRRGSGGHPVPRPVRRPRIPQHQHRGVGRRRHDAPERLVRHRAARIRDRTGQPDPDQARFPRGRVREAQAADGRRADAVAGAAVDGRAARSTPTRCTRAGRRAASRRRRASCRSRSTT